MNTVYDSTSATSTYWVGSEGMPLSEDQKAKLLLSGNSCENCRFGRSPKLCFSDKRKEHYEVTTTMKNGGTRITYLNLPQAAESICGWWEKAIDK